MQHLTAFVVGGWWCGGGHPFPIQSINAGITCQHLNEVPGLNGNEKFPYKLSISAKGGGDKF